MWTDVEVRQRRGPLNGAVSWTSFCARQRSVGQSSPGMRDGRHPNTFFAVSRTQLARARASSGPEPARPPPHASCLLLGRLVALSAACKHFQEEDFAYPVYKILGYKYRKLSADAIPSVNLPVRPHDVGRSCEGSAKRRLIQTLHSTSTSSETSLCGSTATRSNAPVVPDESPGEHLTNGEELATELEEFQREIGIQVDTTSCLSKREQLITIPKNSG
ncbi:hypothetical protein HPB47_023793 [Ixodes persulcatus]|uniref:Uncharacterized protein n=1 Tax=Ixodes persulcatus TaxID=34615 RepID=A0AC60Q605_IXOPE|nr:hypothetical protein HPB47_023793 [Ixodes persulcatus]